MTATGFAERVLASSELLSLLPGGAADPEVRMTRAAWSVIAEPGDGIAGRLVSDLGPVEAFRAAARGGLDKAGVEPRQARAALRRWRPRLRDQLLDDALRRARKARAQLIVPEDDDWPQQLSDLGDHAPLALWARGDRERLTSLKRSAALVGARASSAYGEHVTAEIAGDLADDGVAIVSGAAYGIDAVAHRAAFERPGGTVALLAGGADRVYPAGHARMLASIATRGLVLSEVACGTAPTRWRFLERNRLIAALASATVVVEAGARSGSLNTAGHAAALGRPLGAVPGPVTSATSAGCHRVLREYDGQCITTAADVRELLGEYPGTPDDRGGGEDPAAMRVLDALGARAWRSAEEVARASGLSIDEAEGVLGLLSLSGRAERDEVGGHTWRLARHRERARGDGDVGRVARESRPHRAG